MLNADELLIKVLKNVCGVYRAGGLNLVSLIYAKCFFIDCSISAYLSQIMMNEKC